MSFSHKWFSYISLSVANFCKCGQDLPGLNLDSNELDPIWLRKKASVDMPSVTVVNSYTLSGYEPHNSCSWTYNRHKVIEDFKEIPQDNNYCLMMILVYGPVQSL